MTIRAISSWYTFMSCAMHSRHILYVIVSTIPAPALRIRRKYHMFFLLLLLLLLFNSHRSWCFYTLSHIALSRSHTRCLLLIYVFSTFHFLLLCTVHAIDYFKISWKWRSKENDDNNNKSSSSERPTDRTSKRTKKIKYTIIKIQNNYHWVKWKRKQTTIV